MSGVSGDMTGEDVTATESERVAPPVIVGQTMDDLRDRAARHAYRRIYPGLDWQKASLVGQQEAWDAMKAADVLAVVETNLRLYASLPPTTDGRCPTCGTDITDG